MKPPMQSQLSAQPVPSVASEEVDELPSDIFTESVDITKSKKIFNNMSGNIDINFVLNICNFV